MRILLSFYRQVCNNPVVSKRLQESFRVYFCLFVFVFLLAADHYCSTVLNDDGYCIDFFNIRANFLDSTSPGRVAEIVRKQFRYLAIDALIELFWTLNKTI